MKNLIILVTALFLMTFTLESCSKSTCPTYATSGPSKSVKKKGSQAGSKADNKKNKKTSSGKPSSGLF